MRNFILLILACLVIVSPMSMADKTEKKESNLVCIAIKDDNMSPETCRKWYVVYKGMYHYLNELEGQNSRSFDQVFEKLRIVRDKIGPAKGSTNFAIETQKLLDQYKKAEYNSVTKTDLAKDIFYISEGIREALSGSE